MAIRFISSDAAREDFERVLTEASDSDDEIVLNVDGRPMGMFSPLNARAGSEELRLAFGRFWKEYEAHQLQHPPDLTEDEVMELAIKIVDEVRAKRRAIRDAAERVRSREVEQRSA